MRPPPSRKCEDPPAAGAREGNLARFHGFARQPLRGRAPAPHFFGQGSDKAIMQARTPIDPYAAGSATIPGAAAGGAALAEGAPALPPRVSWGAIAAGAVIAVMIGLMLNILGTAIGVTAVDAVEGDTPDAALHGVGVWAIGFLLSAVLLGNIAAGAASSVFTTASSLLGGAAQGAG